MFCLEIIMIFWFRYMVDLYMDVIAMKIFLESGDYLFFCANLSGVALGLLWTITEIHKAAKDKDEKKVTTRAQVFLVGITLPLMGMHVTYLSVVSLLNGVRHPFLFISTLAESILESAVSASVQTYAVVFKPFSVQSKVYLYQSIAMSFVSIGYAFSTLDKVDGGDLLAKLPGFCRRYDGRWWSVFLFRVCEITSRATSLALFQLSVRAHTRFGMIYMLFGDFVALSTLTAFYQYQVGKFSPAGSWMFVGKNLFYALPSLICMMAPMLEKDCVLTMPPPAYYMLRFVELVVMFVIAGKVLHWDSAAALELFNDDGLVIACFAVSTTLLFILVLIIRRFLTVRVLVEAPLEWWSSRPFNNVQQALRNRIIKASDSDPEEQKLIMRQLRSIAADTIGSSQLLKSRTQGERKSDTHAQWEAKFLRAKVSVCVEQALESLDDAQGGSGMQFWKKGKAKRKGWSKGSGDLQTGALISLKVHGGHKVTNSRGSIVTQRMTETSDQKFLLESEDGPFIKDSIKSGGLVRLRSLSNSKVLGIVSDFKTNVVGFPTDDSKPEAFVFSMVLVYEATYRNARHFKHKVSMSRDNDTLVVDELKHHRAAGHGAPMNWDQQGWQIAAINNEVVTREKVDAILGTSGGTLHKDDTSDLESEAGSIHSRDMKGSYGQYTVLFERVHPGDPLTLEDNVLLRPQVLPDQSVGVGVTQEDDENPKVKLMEAGQLGETFMLQQAEYGSKDDPSIYRWVAELIRKRRDVMALKASLAEKYRIAIVVAYNARTLNVPEVSGILYKNSGLHLRILKSLSQALNSKQLTIRVEYDLFDEMTEELTFTENEKGGMMVSLFAEDGIAWSSGVREKDTLLQMEVFEWDRSIVYMKPDEISKRLKKGEAGIDRIVLLIRSQTENVVDGDVRRIAVNQAEIMATLLPSWAEIEETDTIKETHSDVLREDGFFKIKCSLVSSLIEHGFFLQHDEFVGAARELHERLDVATASRLENLIFPGAINADLRLELLICQLRVLTTSWSAMPTLTKEDDPKSVRELFRAKHELQAILDAVEIVFKRWEKETGGLDKTEGKPVEMPEELQFFLENFPPADSEATSRAGTTTFWITKAFSEETVEYSDVQAIVGSFTKMYRSAERYWIRRVDGAAARLDKAQHALEGETQGAESVKIVLIASENDLRKVKDLMNPDLKLKQSCVLGGDNPEIPSGAKLLIQGTVKEHFSNKGQQGQPVKPQDVYSGLMELGKGVNAAHELRLLFSTDAYAEKQAAALMAVEELGELITAIQKAAVAFPDSIGETYEELKQRHHKGQLQVKDQESKRNLKVQQKELADTMRVANNRLAIVEGQKQRLEGEKDQLLKDKQSLEGQKEQLLKDKQGLEGEKEQLLKDKDILRDENAAVEIEKSQIEQQKRQIEHDFEQLSKEQAILKQKEKEQQDVLKLVATQQEEQMKRQQSMKRERSSIVDQKEEEKQEQKQQDLLSKVYGVLGWSK